MLVLGGGYPYIHPSPALHSYYSLILEALNQRKPAYFFGSSRYAKKLGKYLLEIEGINTRDVEVEGIFTLYGFHIKYSGERPKNLWSYILAFVSMYAYSFKHSYYIAERTGKNKGIIWLWFSTEREARVAEASIPGIIKGVSLASAPTSHRGLAVVFVSKREINHWRVMKALKVKPYSKNETYWVYIYFPLYKRWRVRLTRKAIRHLPKVFQLISLTPPDRSIEMLIVSFLRGAYRRFGRRITAVHQAIRFLIRILGEREKILATSSIEQPPLSLSPNLRVELKKLSGG